MPLNPVSPTKRAWLATAAVALVPVLASCGGGSSSSTSTTTTVRPYVPAYQGVNCAAVTTGIGAGLVVGVCDEIDANNTERARSNQHDFISSFYSSRSAPDISDAIIKGLGLTLEAPFDKVTIGLSYGPNSDPCTYYSRFGALRGMTLTQFAGETGFPLVDMTSLASVTPGIAGPGPNQSTGPCGNAQAEPTLPAAITLTGVDFGVYRFYAGMERGQTDASYNGGWYSRLGTGDGAVPVADLVFVSSNAKLGGYYATPNGLWSVSTSPASAAWSAAAQQITVSLTGAWSYYNRYAVTPSIGISGGGSPIPPNPTLSALELKGVYDPIKKKVIGTVSSLDPAVLVEQGSFEGEFSADGREFAGRFAVKIQGVEATLGAAFAAKQ
jgi:hypothetical protein